MDSICRLLERCNISTDEHEVDELANLMSDLNIKEETMVDDLASLFTEMNISENEISQLADESETLIDFCKSLQNIIKDRANKRCLPQDTCFTICPKFIF